MTSTANLTRDETAARAAEIRLETVDVEVDLRDAASADAATFPTASTLKYLIFSPLASVGFALASYAALDVVGVAGDAPTV